MPSGAACRDSTPQLWFATEVAPTRITLAATPLNAWPLLFDSRMDRPTRCPVFALGTPRPVQCAIPGGTGGLGAERECRAAQGTNRQRITRWEPGEALEFQMLETDLAFSRCVDAINERFTLTATPQSATRLTRVTTVTLRGALPAAKAAVMYVGLKAVHRYVFSSWRRQCRGMAPAGVTI